MRDLGLVILHLEVKKILLIICTYLILSINLKAADENVVQACLSNLKDVSSDTLSLPYANMLHSTGVCFFEEEFYYDAAIYLKRSLLIAKIIAQSDLVKKNAIKLGTAYFWMTEYEKALEHLEWALNNDSIVRTPKDSITIYTTIGNIYYYMDKKQLSYQYSIKALEITPDQTDPQIMGDSYFVLAKMEVDQKRFDAGLEKINKAISFYESINNLGDLSYCYDVLAEIYHQTGKYELALKYVKLSCEIDSDDYEQYYEAYCSHFYAEIYESMQEYDQALSYYENAMTIMEQSDQYGEQIETRADMGKLLAKMGRCEEGLEVLKRCIDAAREKKSRPILRDVYQNLFEASQNCGNYKNAVLYLQKYMHLKDSLLTESNLEEVAIMGTNYELKQQKQELAILQKDRKLQSAYNYLMLGAILVLFTFVFLGAWTYKKQQRQNQLFKANAKTIADQNEKLLTTNTELKVANVELKQFAYIVSHDLKAPLRGISTLASFIEEDLEEELTVETKLNIKENLKVLKGRITRMGNLIHGILAYSRIGRKDGEVESVDLNNTLQELIQGIVSSPQIEIKLPEHLPIITAPKIAIQQIFQNLISNAINYNDKTTCKIEIDCRYQSNNFLFSLKDNGPGIPEKYHEKIFEIFQTLQARDRVESTGVGLSIVKKRIESLGGEIWVKSIVSEGTTFIFSLPQKIVNQPVLLS